MTNVFTNLRNTGRAAVMAVVLGTTVLGAMPAMAQGAPQTNFQLELGAGAGTSIQSNGFAKGEPNGKGNYEDYCLSNRDIREGLRDFGFERVRIGERLGNDRVRVYARYDHDLYSMRVDRCSGRVDRVKRVFGFGY